MLALVCVLVWGGSFSVIRWGLQDLPPLAFASLRFGLVALLIPFVPRPTINWSTIFLYGTGWGAVQFSGLFLAIHHGLPTSLSSVLAQSQVFFTLLFGKRLAVPPVKTIRPAASCDFLTRRSNGDHIEMASAY